MSEHNRLALPLAFAAAFLLHSFWVTAFLFQFISTFIHEVGHSMFYLLGSTACVPTPMMVTACFARSSWWMFASLLALGLFFYFRFKKEGYSGLSQVCLLLLGLLVMFTFLLPERMATMFGIFGGLAGELIVGSALVLLYYARMPERYNWKVNRYIVLVAGAYSVFQACLLWGKVLLGIQPLPLGSAWRGAEDPHGDLNRLLNEYNWSELMVTTTYSLLSVACVLAIVGIYISVHFAAEE